MGVAEFFFFFTFLFARDSANLFVDRRIGERDKHLSEEDKMLRRLQKERAKQARKASRYTLDEDDDGDDDGMDGAGESSLFLSVYICLSVCSCHVHHVSET